MAVKKVFLHFLILVLHFPLYESTDIITTNKTFQDGDVMISKNKKFSLGFFTPENSRYRYLGIRFHSISEASVVWVANRNHPISGSTGFLSINQYGNLVLYNDPIQKSPLWSTNVSSEATSPSIAQLLDTGNLVLLQGRKRKILWQGFDYPTDTHLPGMNLREDKVTLAENAKKSNLSVRKDLKILIFSVTSVWLTVIFFSYLWIRRKKRVLKNRLQKKLFDPTFGSVYYKNTLVASELRQSSNSPDIPFFDFSSIVEATDNFSSTNKLGEGGFGVVYKGHLFDGQEVAIKRLSKNSDQGVEEFKNEVMLIAKLQHRNLVKLLGYCIDEEERLLIYEYMPNKALDSILFDQTRRSLLDWRKRFEIIIEIARGLVYLHKDSRLNVIHRDLKCSNILMDANMKPKISDFGMARIFRVDQIQEKTNRVVGTYGYMSPEYALLGKFSVKSDAFSFGVMLLEIVSAKKNNNFREEDTSLTLIGDVWDLWKQGRALEIIDPLINGSCEPHQVLRCINIGLLCVQENARDRPTMPEVVWMLSSESAVTSPKKPAFTYTNTSQEATGGSKSTNEVSISVILPR